MPYPIPLSTGHSKKKKKNPKPELREDDPPRFTEKTRSLALAAMVRVREKREAWSGGLRWGRDSGSGHGGLVMAFMSTIVLGLKRKEQTRE